MEVVYEASDTDASVDVAVEITLQSVLMVLGVAAVVVLQDCGGYIRILEFLLSEIRHPVSDGVVEEETARFLALEPYKVPARRTEVARSGPGVAGHRRDAASLIVILRGVHFRRYVESEGICQCPRRRKSTWNLFLMF